MGKVRVTYDDGTTEIVDESRIPPEAFQTEERTPPLDEANQSSDPIIHALRRLFGQGSPFDEGMAAVEAQGGPNRGPTGLALDAAAGPAGAAGSRLLGGLGRAGAAAGRRAGFLPNLYDRGLEAGGEGLVPADSLIKTLAAIADRIGSPAAPAASGRLLKNVQGRPFQEALGPAGGPMLPLKELENIRRVAGEASTVKGSRVAGKQLVGAAKGDIAAAGEAGLPGAGDLARATQEERALQALIGKPGMRELLTMLGLGGGGLLAGGPVGSAAAVALPRLFKLMMQRQGPEALTAGLSLPTSTGLSQLLAE